MHAPLFPPASESWLSAEGDCALHRLAIVKSVAHVSVLGGLSSSAIDVGSFHLCLCVFRAGVPGGVMWTQLTMWLPCCCHIVIMCEC